MLQYILEKYFSRKFILAIVGIVTGLVAMKQGEVAAGSALVGTSIIGYLVAEGYIDAKAATTIVEAVEDITDAATGGDKDGGD